MKSMLKPSKLLKIPRKYVKMYAFVNWKIIIIKSTGINW